jgi:hypothetical protein
MSGGGGAPPMPGGAPMSLSPPGAPQAPMSAMFNQQGGLPPVY